MRQVEEIILHEEVKIPEGTPMIGMYKLDKDIYIMPGNRIRMNENKKVSVYDDRGKHDIAYEIFSKHIWEIAKQHKHTFRVVGIKEVAEEIVSIEKDNTVPKPDGIQAPEPQNQLPPQDNETTTDNKEQ